jgi:hypothetical protein
MARNPRQNANLRRGGAPATPESAQRARAAKARHEADDEEARERAKVDPTAAVLELVGDLAVGVRKLMRKWLATGGEPPKVLIDALREFRQASRDAVEYLGARGANAEAEVILDKLEERLKRANLGEGLRPYLERRESPGAA